MISLAAMPLSICREKGSVSHTLHKHKTGVRLFGSSDGCTPVFLFSFWLFLKQGASCTLFELPSYEPVCGQRHIPHGYDQPPYQDKTAYHTADNKIENKQRDTSAEGAAARYDPKAHPMESERQAAKYP